MAIPIPSGEQMTIINSVFLNNDVIVNAVSGSGKSTCVLSMAKYIDKKILQVTYNRSLRKEVKSKAYVAGLMNIKIHTYHSLAVKYYDSTAYTDEILDKVVKNNTPAKMMDYFDVIVIDETQDMTMLLYRFIKKFVTDMIESQACNNIFGIRKIIRPVIVVMGDEFQAVYEFKGADRRFLTAADQFWDMKKFMRLPLQTSYRVTNQIAAFVNNELLGYNRIIACKDGPPIDYITGNAYNNLSVIYFLIRDSGYKPGEIFILLASVRTESDLAPFKRLEHILTDNGWPVYISDSDEARPSDQVMEGKTVFCTFHQSKGRERAMVIILGFDVSYFEFFARDLDRSVCPATLYVAATRASQRLVISDNSFSSGGHLPFMKNYSFFKKPYIKHYGVAYTRPFVLAMNKHKVYSAINLVNHLPYETVAAIMPLLDQIYTIHRVAGESITLLSEYKNEEVSGLNGIIIPAVFEYIHIGNITIKKFINKYLDDYNKTVYEDRKSVGGYGSAKQSGVISIINPADIPKDFKTPADFIKLAIIYQAVSSGLTFKLKQITDYDWLTFNEINWCLANMREINGRECVFEMPIDCTYKSHKFGEVGLRGCIDIIDIPADTVYEIKCVENLTMEHKLQLIIYFMIGFFNKNIHRKYRLLNIKNGECLEIQPNWPAMLDILDLLLSNKTI